MSAGAAGGGGGRARADGGAGAETMGSGGAPALSDGGATNPSNSASTALWPPLLRAFGLDDDEDEGGSPRHPFGLDAAGERNHEHLTALAAAVAVQPCIDVARRDDILAALEFIAECDYEETDAGAGPASPKGAASSASKRRPG